MRLVFEWDASKAKANLEKHKITFEEAKTVFNDPQLVTFADQDHSDDEDRFISIGLSANSRVLLVVHTEEEARTDELVIRIISCRKATASERRTYEKNKD